VSVAALVLLAVFGRFLIRWRRLALSGFGLGLRTNVPPIFYVPMFSSAIWIIGHAATLAACVILLFWVAWYWAILAAVVGGALEWRLVMLVCWRDISAARDFRREHAAEFAEFDRLGKKGLLEDEPE
jgi:hypothetical protein